MGSLLAAAYSSLGLFHAAFGVVALVLGFLIFAATKGTLTHIRLGWAYVVSMLCLNVSSLMIYNLTGRFNLFHALALVSLAMVLAGVAQVVYRGRIRKWLWRHYQYMCWSYVGLLAATCNEAFVRIPPLRRVNMWVGQWLPIVASALIVLTSGVAIIANQRRLLALFGDPPRS